MELFLRIQQQQQLQLPNEIYSFLPTIKSLLPSILYGAVFFILLLLFVVFILPWLIKQLNKSRSRPREETRSFEQRWWDLSVDQHFESDYTAAEYFGALSILLRESFEEFSGISVTDMTAAEIQQRVFMPKVGQNTDQRITKENVPYFVEFLIRSEQVQFANIKTTKDEATLWYKRVGQLISHLKKAQMSEEASAAAKAGEIMGRARV